MDSMLEFFPVVLYILGTILLIILIILSIKLIHTINKTNVILDDAYNKTKSLNGLFNAIDSITDTLSVVGDTVVGAITSAITKLFVKKKKNEKEKEEDE